MGDFTEFFKLVAEFKAYQEGKEIMGDAAHWKERAEKVEVEIILRYNEAIAYKERAESAEAKNVNLHKAMVKMGQRIVNQRARINELETLWAGTKRSRNHQKLKEKYKALKSHLGLWSGGVGW